MFSMERTMTYKTIINNLRDSQSLSLSDNNIGEGDIEYLAQALEGTQITSLDLNDNDIGCVGLKCLSQVLKDTQITILKLKNNNIADEGVKYLADSLKDSQISELHLSGNQIGCYAAQYLHDVLSNTKVRFLFLDVCYTEDGGNSNYISLSSYCGLTDITLHNNEIGFEGAQVLNKMFQHISIRELTLDGQDLEADHAEHLAIAFKYTKINQLRMSYNHIMQHNGILYLVQAFEDSQIAKLNVQREKLRTAGVKCLSEILKKIKVLELDLRLNYIGDEGMMYLVPALENSDIMYLDLAWNDIEAQGVKYLSEILKNSKILFIDLCHNYIGPDGARYLADGLPYSQVTGIHLHGNMIEYAGYQSLIDVVDNTNISWVNLHDNNIEAGLEEGTRLWPYRIPRNTVPIDLRIRHAFKELVSLDTLSDEFEFIVPRKDTSTPVDIGEYAFLIRILNENPNSKAHIFDAMCKNKNNDYYDFSIMHKINEFVEKMPKKFNTFIDNKLPSLVESYDSYEFVGLVNKFEEMKHYGIVQNLLLHRVLYYVDENQEILHPFIYKLLDKYNMPLYNEQLEPNKKNEIIAYYQSHQEIDGIQEILDLLESQSLR